MKVTITLSGGLELLFGKVKLHNIDLPDKTKITVKNLLQWIKENLIKERPELFIQNGTLRPGVLLMINDTDWEVLGKNNYEVEDGDSLAFISTLHGG